MSGSARGSYNFRIQAEGFAEFIRDLQKVAGESEAAHQVIGKLIQGSPQLASAMDAAAQATERAARRATELREAQDRAATSSQAMVPAARTATQALEGLEGKTQAARRAMNDFRGAIELVGLGGLSSALGPVGGLLGNVADAFGTAATASGRLSLGMNGLVAAGGVLSGLLVGIGASALALNVAYEAQARRVDEVRFANEAYSNALRAANELTRTATERSEAAAQAARDEAMRRLELGIAIERENLARANATAARAAEVRQRLEDAVTSGRAAPGQVQGGLDRARETATGLASIAQAIDARLAGLEAALIQAQRTGVPRYSAPIGPQAPPADRPIGGGRAPAPERSVIYEGGLDPGSTVFPVEVEGIITRNLESQRRAEERAREQAQRAEDRALEQRQRANERTTDSIVQYSADRFADLLDRNGQGWAGLMRTFEATARSTFARIAAEAIIRPIISPIVEGIGGGISGLLSGITGGGGGGGGLLGGIGNLSGLSSLIPGGGLSGLLAMPVFGTGALTSATNSALAGMGGAMGPATAAQVGLPGVSLGGALAGIGGGFAIGSTIGGFIAGDSANRQTNSMIGSGIGAVGGFLLGGPVGGLIGGTAGGALGGLIGPGEGFEGGDALVGFDANGQLVVSGYQGKNFAEQAQLMAAARQQVAQVNAGLSATGLSFAGRSGAGGFATAIGGGQSPNPTDIAGALAASGFGAGSLISGNANVRTALGAQPGASVTAAIETAAWVQQTYEVLAGIKVPAEGFQAALEAVDSTFGSAIARARELQLATDGLVAAQQEQREEILAEQNRQIGNVQGSITSRWFRAVGMDLEAALNDFDLGAKQQIADVRAKLESLGVTAADVTVQVGRLTETQALERANLVRSGTSVTASGDGGAASARQLLESLTVGGLGGLSPEARAVAARRSIEAARGAFRDGASAAEIAEFSRVVQAGLPVIQQSEGITTGLSSLVASITDTLRQVAPGADVANLAGVIDATRASGNQVEAAIDRWGGRVETLARELATLTEQVRVLAAR